MQNINSFKINRNLDVYVQANELENYIENFVNQKELEKIILYLSKNTGIPKEVIDYETKQYLSREFNYLEGKFSKNFKITGLIKSIFIYFITFFWVIFFSKKKKEIKCDLVIDEIEHEEQAKRLLLLTEEFKSYLFISKIDIDKKFRYLKFDSMKGCIRDVVFPNFHKYIFNFFLTTLKGSIMCKTNLILIVLHILKRIIKYDSLFKQINAKFLFQERFYTTSSIKNFLFKKHGGKITSCFQRNNIHIMNNGFYINTDLFFSLGNKSILKDNFRGLKIKQIIPVGSIIMEGKWFFSKKVDVPEYDIINLCSANLIDFSTNEFFLNDYYEHYKWLAKLSIEFPNLKIALKYGAGYPVVDQKEINIIKDTNIERITDGVSNENYSYGYAMKAKFICSFCSTVANEMLGHNKPSFFLDPGGRNTCFLHKDKYNDSWRLKSYEEFREKVKTVIFSKEKIEVKNSNDFCLQSDNVSKRISANLLKRI